MTKHPSTPWDWRGGYPQEITGPDATLIAQVYENPDMPASIAPLICDAVNAYLAPSRLRRVLLHWRGRKARRLHAALIRRATNSQGVPQ